MSLSCIFKNVCFYSTDNAKEFSQSKKFANVHTPLNCFLQCTSYVLMNIHLSKRKNILWTVGVGTQEPSILVVCIHIISCLYINMMTIFFFVFNIYFLFKMNALSKVKLCPRDQVCFDCKKTMSTLNDHSRIVYNLSIF